MKEISIGRVITTERGKGYGKQMMLYAIDAAIEHFDAKLIDIEAQKYAKGFYESVGFRQSSEQFQYAMSVGVTAPFYLTKLFVPHFAEGAAIVNISSSRNRMSQPQTESYTAAKGGIAALTHALAVSLAGKVRVNSISPITAILLVDIGAQCIQISNQSRCLQQLPEATNRVNTIFMTLFFIGGSLGTLCAGLAFSSVSLLLSAYERLHFKNKIDI